ncbi:MAG: NusG domain II-containing protein [Candidatus Coproplasma sp.]
MSYKKIEQIKKTKYFKFWDFLVYGIILLVIAALFLVVFLTGDKTSANGFIIRQANKVVFTYYFDTDKYEYSMTDGRIVIDSEDESSLNLTVYTQDKSGYNKVKVDKINNSVKVEDANCSLLRKDCVYTPALKDNSSYISCLPHEMYIEPLLKRVDNPEEIPIG